MKINGTPYRTIWLAHGGAAVEIIDQTRLPHELVIVSVADVQAAVHAIKSMQVRGAPLIGAMAAYGVALAMRLDASDGGLNAAIEVLAASRPTAVNLAWALRQMEGALRPLPPEGRAEAAFAKAAHLADEDVATNRRIGERGVTLIREHAIRKAGGVVNILTHCNAGWLATVDWGTALAPIYLAHDEGIAVHVWVDETRPRNQGAALTAYELHGHGVPYTVIADNAGGHLMQHAKVDICIVGADRVAANGDAANKIGTYLKALAAYDNGVPFYVAIPHSTIDWTLETGRAIPIEERDAREVTHLTGRTAAGAIEAVEVTAPGSAAANPAFDVTPARLLTGLITERGVCAASREGLAALYPESAGFKEKTV